MLSGDMAAGRARSTSVSVKPIQDAGWSWVIAAACCWVTFVIQGLVRSSGVIYVALIDTYGVTRSQASWPFTLRMAVWNLSGPLAGALSYKWSIRTITFIGILIVAAGYVICWFATDFVIVTVFLGVLQGLGVGISVTLVPVIINQYFSKYKSTGAGIACAGATVGSFALSPLVELIIEEYGLRGAFLMMGGITLHGVLGAALLRPADWLKTESQNTTQKRCKMKQYGSAQLEKSQQATESKPFLTNGDSVKSAMLDATESISPHRKDIKRDSTTLPETHSALDCKVSINYAQNGVCESRNSHLECGQVNGNTTNDPSTQSRYMQQNGSDLLHDQDEEEVLIKGGRLQFSSDHCNYNPRINIVPLQGLQKTQDYRCDSYPISDIRYRNGKSDKSQSKSDSAILERCPKWKIKLGGLLEPMKAASSVLTNTMFLLIAFNYSVFFLSYMTYLIVIVDYALDLGMPRTDSVFLVSTFSIADLCGRLGSGWLTDSGFVKRKNLLMTNMTLVGLLLISTSFTQSYMSLMAVSVLTGLVVGVTLIIFYALLEEYLGLQKMAMAVGLMNFCIGCLSLVTPFLTGAFRDTLGSYTYLFYFLGSLSLFSGFLWAVQSIADTYNNNKNISVEADVTEELK